MLSRKFVDRVQTSGANFGVFFAFVRLTYSPGSSSDQAAFYQRAGVSSLDIWMTYDEVHAFSLLSSVYINCIIK